MHLCNITTRLPMLDEYHGHRLLQQIELDKREFKVQESIKQVSKLNNGGLLTRR
jgi:hypothetical protein